MREFTLTIGMRRGELEGWDFKEMLSHIAILQSLGLFVLYQVATRSLVKHRCFERLNNNRCFVSLQRVYGSAELLSVTPGFFSVTPPA